MSTESERAGIINSVQKLISERLFHPWWPTRQVADKAASIENIRRTLENASEEEFEKSLNVWLCGFDLSHMAFFHISGRQVPAQFAIGAELRAFQNGDGYAWFVQHVMEGGAAHQAGIRLGDAVLAVNGRKLSPPNEPRFQLGESHDVLVQKKSEADTRTIKVHVPHATEKDRPPMVSHNPLSYEVLQQRIGVIRVTAFPGAAGFEFALRLDQIITHLKAEGCERLIVDMRGNPGGGLGSLRLMSYLVPDRRPTGYSLTRRGKDRGKRLANLTRIGRIPHSKLGLWLMAFRFGVLHRDRSLSLWTESLVVSHSTRESFC